MSSSDDKLKGNANEAVGKIKQGVGEATNNPRMKGEGQRQETPATAPTGRYRPATGAPAGASVTTRTASRGHAP